MTVEFDITHTRGGYFAKARGHDIFTESKTADGLQTACEGAARQHFNSGDVSVRLQAKDRVTVPMVTKHEHLAEVGKWRSIARSLEARVVDLSNELSAARASLDEIRQLTKP